MNVFTATRTLGFVSKLFTAAKLNLDDFVAAGDETALAAHLDAHRAPAAPAAVAPPAVLDVTATEAALLTAAGLTLAEGQTPAQALAAYVSAHTAQVALHTSLVSALTASGVKWSSDADPATLPAALESRIATRAGEELAKRGLRDFPEQHASTDPTKAPKAEAANVTGFARAQAAFAAETATRIQRN